MPVVYFESLINTFKNVLIDQLNNNTNNPVSINLNNFHLNFLFFI